MGSVAGPVAVLGPAKATATVLVKAAAKVVVYIALAARCLLLR